MFPNEDTPVLSPELSTDASLRDSIVAAEGFVTADERSEVDGVTLDGRAAAVVLGADEFLTSSRVAEAWSQLSGRFDKLSIYYFRSTDDIDDTILPRGILLKRVPMDLTL